MPIWVCDTCGVEHADTLEPPSECAICSDERQWVPRGGQRWTTLEQLQADGIEPRFQQLEPGLVGITTSPDVGIGHQMKLVITNGGNLLFDPLGYVDQQTAANVLAHGPVIAIAASHPHMYGAQVSWSVALGGPPVFVHEADARWVRRDDECLWAFSGSAELTPGLSLHTLGGHFPGSTVALWDAGADGRGVLLAGDGIFPNPNGSSVSFMRSYPNRVPLSPAVVERLAATALQWKFDRLYNNFKGVIEADAHAVIRRSAAHYAAWARGDYDHLT